MSGLRPMSALKSTILLTAVSLFSQAVGFVYRVLLSRTVGSENMGLFHLVMPAFSVMMSLTSVGFTVACSTLTARYRALGDHRAAAQTLRCCLFGFLGSFALLALVAIPLSDAISVYLLGDARTRLGLLLLLPCLLLTGLENLHKHAFYGSGRVGPPAFSETCEQLIRAGAVLGLLWRFLPQNPEKTVGLIILGMILCEVFSAVTLTVLYRRCFGSSLTGTGVNAGGLRRQVGHIALPVAWHSLLGNLMGAAQAVMIPRRLVHMGTDVSRAMSALGVLQGMTLPLLTLPTAFLSAMGLVLLPRLTQAIALGRKDTFRRQADKAITATAWLIFPSAALLAVLAPPLGRTLFREETVGQFALPLALAVALACFETVLGVCLNGLGKQSVTARNSLIAGVSELLVAWWRMGRPGIGLRGYVEAFLLGAALGACLNWLALRRASGMSPRWFRWVVAPGLSALLSGLCVNLLFPLVTRAGLGDVSGCLVCLTFGILLYLCAMNAQGVFHRSPGRVYARNQA